MVKSKISLIIGILLFCFVFIGTSTAATVEWHSEKITDKTIASNIALDSDGKPHIIYSKSHVMVYAYKKGNVWQKRTVDNDGLAESIVLDSYNRPHITYLNNGVYYAHWTGNTWKKEYVGSGAYSSLALDSKNQPHISYCDYWSFDIKYAKWTGTSWKKTTIDTIPPDAIQQSSITLDSHDKPRIFYNTNCAVKYAVWNGAIWTKTTIADGYHSYDCCSKALLKLDSANIPHICYLEGWKLIYAKWNGSRWTKTIVDNSANEKSHLSFALSIYNTPRILYYDKSSHILRYAAKIGQNPWTITNIANAYGQIAIDYANNPRISLIKSNQDLIYKFTVNKFTNQEIVTSALKVNNYIEKYHKLPKNVTIAGYLIKMPQFLHLSANAILKISSHLNTFTTLGYYGSATHSENMHTGKILNPEYLKIANFEKKFSESTGFSPGYYTSTLGVMRFENLILLNSKILSFYKIKGLLPGYVLIKPWKQN